MPARDPQAPSALTRMAPAVLLAALLLLTAAATYTAARRVHDRQREQLTGDAQDAVAAIDRRMDDYGQVLRGAAGLYAASNTVSYREFHDYFADQDIARRFPGVQVIGSASYVPRAGIPDYTRRTRAAIKASRLKGYGPFRPYPKLGAGESEALIVDHLEPPPGNGRAFGLNFLSEPRRRTAALLARRTGDPASTAPIALVQTGGESLGIDLFVPVYGGPPAQRRAAPLGRRRLRRVPDRQPAARDPRADGRRQGRGLRRGPGGDGPGRHADHGARGRVRPAPRPARQGHQATAPTRTWRRWRSPGAAGRSPTRAPARRCPRASARCRG